MKSVLVLLSTVVFVGCSQVTSVAETSAELKVSSQAPLSSQEVKGLHQFIGKWQSNADTFGQPAVSTMHWGPVLEGQFIRLDYAINPASKEVNKSIFSGVAYYKMADGPELKAFWADTSGDLHPITATLADGILTSVWGIEGQKLGKTRYELTVSNGDQLSKIEVTDWIMREGKYQQFNNNTFSKVDD